MYNAVFRMSQNNYVLDIYLLYTWMDKYAIITKYVLRKTKSNGTVRMVLTKTAMDIETK